MSKSGPQQQRIYAVLNWIRTNADRRCLRWLENLNTAITTLIGNPAIEESVLIGHGSFSNSSLNAIIGQDPLRSKMPPGFLVVMTQADFS
jgi:hypothetical protein